MADLIVGGLILGTIVSLLVISNPVSTAAVFISLTQKMSHKNRVETAKRSVKYSVLILLFFSLTGFFLFEIFGVSIGAFRIAGGIILFTISIGMIDIKPTSHHAKMTSQDIALIPLSVPFTSGPGTITAVIIFMTEALALVNTGSTLAGIIGIAGVYLGITIVALASYLTMKNSERIDKMLKEGGRHVVTKLMGLLVMAMSIQFIINGIIDIAPQLIASVA